MLRAVFVIALLPTASAWAQDTGSRVVAVGGIEWSRFDGVEPLDEEGHTTTGFVIRDSGFGVTLGGEVGLLPWLSAGIAYQWLSRLQLEQSFDVDGFRDFGNELVRTLDPRVTELYVAPSWPASGAIRITGLAGVGFWSAERTDTLTLLFQDAELSRERLLSELGGTSLVVGIGVDTWFHPRVGARVGYKYLRLSDDEFEQPVHDLRILALIGFG